MVITHCAKSLNFTNINLFTLDKNASERNFNNRKSEG